MSNDQITGRASKRSALYHQRGLNSGSADVSVLVTLAGIGARNARMLMVGPFLLMIGVVLNLSDFAFDLGLNMAGETHYIFVRTKWVIAKEMLCQIVAGLVV